MHIDWLTVVAQIINFLILVWLLKRFLYQPVLDAMSRREQRIAGELQDAQESQRVANETRQQYQERIDSFDRKQQQMREQACHEIADERKQMLEQARDEVTQQRSSWQRQLEAEKSDFLKRLKAQLIDSIQSISRRTLTDLANLSLEANCVQVFIDKLAQLSKEERKPFAQSTSPLRLTSAFALHPEQQQTLHTALQELLHTDASIEFEHNPELICGIALSTDDYRLDWNVDNYLSHLEADIARLLESR